MVLARDPDLERRIADLALGRYGHRPRVQKYNSENNYVCRLRFDGSIPDRVIKVGLHLAPAVRQEAEVLRRLHAAGLEVPEVEFTGDDAPDAELTFFVMPHFGDMDLGQACSNDLDWAEAGCERAGSFIARLHALPLSVLDGLVPQHYGDMTTAYPGERWERLRSISLDGRPGESFFDAVCAVVNADVSQPERVVVHDSFIPLQVITDGEDVFAVTDWETIRTGRALQDVSCFGAGLRAWYGGNQRYLDALVRGMTGGAGLDADTAHRLVAWQCHRLFTWAEFGLRSGRDEAANDLIAKALDLGREL